MNNNVAFFNGTTGKLIKDSGLTISGSNTGDQTATTVPNTPAGSISSNTVQGALNELASEKQPLDATLTSISALGTTADKMIYTTALDTFAETPLTAFARTLIDDADAMSMRTTLDVYSTSEVDSLA